MKRSMCQPIVQHMVSGPQRLTCTLDVTVMRVARCEIACQPSAYCASHRGKQLSLWHLGYNLTVMLKCNAISYQDPKLPFLRHQIPPSEDLSVYWCVSVITWLCLWWFLGWISWNMRYFILSKQIFPRHHSKTRHNEQNIKFPKH